VSSLALNWFKDHFIKCNDRAALVKTWLPVTYDGPKTWLDQLVYDRALVLVSHQKKFGRSDSNVQLKRFYAESNCSAKGVVGSDDDP
jgi:hypothetical protein